MSNTLEQSDAVDSKPVSGGFSYRAPELCKATSHPTRAGLFHNIKKKDYECCNSRFQPSQQLKIKEFDFINYFKYDDRILTFKNLWPKTHSMKAEDLAKAGFVYTGEGEKVSCPWCNIVLTDWDPFDEAFLEHRRHSPQCDFILMLFPSQQQTLSHF